MINGFHAFVRAVGWGTLAGAAPYTAFFVVPLALTWMGEGTLAEPAILFAYPLILSGALVLGSALVFGLPLTALLSRSERENGGAYGIAGLILGMLVASMVHFSLAHELNAETLFFAAPGAFAGLVTGISWGRWREAQRAAQALD